ncbi:MAG: GatB/YqeY domain-containing protein [Alphaproteobacteria bacterium]|nr:GatB/YqeY domain-containing protein [Alphaproteobacteria bacterium]
MLRERLKDELKKSMLAKEQRATATLRLILAALQDRDIAGRSKGQADGIGEDEILSMLQTMIKQRRESIEMYTQGGREELAKQESEEIAVIESFLPAQMDDAAIEAATSKAIESVGASGVKEMGKVMAALREQYAGQMDFARPAPSRKGYCPVK